MSALADLIRAEIALRGPMPIDRFMETCLSHPDHGYYRTRDPLGGTGDFITAPEVSQMFGEMIALWLAQCWSDQGAPPRIVLAELGPGRGTLMADICRTFTSVPGISAAAEVCLLDTSPPLRAAAEQALPDVDIRWLESLRASPDVPMFLVANEFFDALPAQQFQRVGDAWMERAVGLSGNKFEIKLISPQRQEPTVTNIPDGTIVELRPAAHSYLAEINRRVGVAGAALIIDYGAWRGVGDTLQAVQNHRIVPALEAPGDADLTTHVCFADLAAAAADTTAYFTTQGAFLERLGITARARALARGDQEKPVATAHRRLTHPDEMGHLFKCLALLPPGAPQPPGFESDDANPR